MRTHYDVLNLDKNCSAREIKEAFIKLSKEYHPDINKGSDAHKKFVEVNEAYTVLGKPSSRHKYDETLPVRNSNTVRSRDTYKTYTRTKTPYEHYCEMHANNIRRHQEGSQGYFTTSKLKVLCFCFFLMAVGSGLQIIAETHRRMRRSHQIAVSLKEARREQRIREMRRSLVKNESENLNPGEQ